MIETTTADLTGTQIERFFLIIVFHTLLVLEVQVQR